VPRAAKARHPEIAWRGVADFGNVLRHDYPSVKDRRVWEIVTDDLGPLKAVIATLLHDLEAEGGERGAKP
jgi:uncharacterized protein with HEPN domain